MKLSIVICVYNTDEKLLNECLASITNSTLDEDYEIVFVDDGSTKSYADLLLKYKVNYCKIDNRGHLGARLFGIKAASGKYVAFVDSDDTVSKNYHKPMLELAEKTDADIVLNGWAFHTDRTKRVCVNDTTMASRIDVKGDDALLLYTAQRGREHSYFVNWNKIYRRELLLRTISELEAIGIANKRLTYSEDALMNFFNFKNAKHVVNTNTGFYFYRIHSSQTVTATDADKVKGQVAAMCASFGIMEEHIGNNKHRETILSNLCEWKRLMFRTHKSYAKSLKSASLLEFVKECYGLDNAPGSVSYDGAVYSNAELLGNNFEQIDAVIAEIYSLGRATTALYEKKSKVISRLLYACPNDVVFSQKAEYTVPRRDIAIRDRIIHNPIVYKVGMIFFKKGSKLRNFLKKHL